MSSPVDIAGGLSAEERRALASLSGSDYAFSNPFKDKWARQGLSRLAPYDPRGFHRLTDLGRAVAAIVEESGK